MLSKHVGSEFVDRMRDTSAMLHVCIDKVRTLHVNAFHKEVAINLNLDGTEAQIGRVLAVKDYRSALEVKSVAVELNDVFRDGDGGGVVFVDLTGNGLHSRCILKRGARERGRQVLTVLTDACNAKHTAHAAILKRDAVDFSVLNDLKRQRESCTLSSISSYFSWNARRCLTTACSIFRNVFLLKCACSWMTRTVCKPAACRAIYTTCSSRLTPRSRSRSTLSLYT